MFIGYVGCGTVVSQIEVVGLGGELGCEGVDLLDDGQHSELLAVLAHLDHHLLGVDAVLEYVTSDLEVGEALALGLTQQGLAQFLEGVQGGEFCGSVDDVHQLVDEPAVYLGELVYLLGGVAVGQGLGYDKDAVVGGLAEGLVDVLYWDLLVAGEAVGSLSDHSQTLLQGFLEGAADSHYLTDALHAAADLTGHAVELGEVPAGNLADHVVQCGLEEGRSSLGNGVLQLEQAVA